MFKKVAFVSMENVLESQLACIGAPLLCCSEVESETTEHRYAVIGEFIHLCSSQKSFMTTIFSSTDLHMKNLTANTVVSAVQKSENIVLKRNDETNTCQPILKMVN